MIRCINEAAASALIPLVELFKASDVYNFSGSTLNFLMNPPSNSLKSNFHYLMLKETLQEVNTYQPQLKQLVVTQIDEKNAAQMHKDSLEEQKKVYSFLLENIKDTDWGSKCISKLTQQFVRTAKSHYEFDSQRNYFLVESYRQLTSSPTVQKDQQCFNLLPLYRVLINKQLRRVIWVKSFCSEPKKQEYFTFDHKISPYNLHDELMISLNRLCLLNGVKLRPNQMTVALRLLDYIVKKWDRLPTHSEQYLALNVVDLYSHYGESRMHQLGAIYVGLIELSEFYCESDAEKRYNIIKLAFKIVDSEVFQIIEQYYSDPIQKQQQIDECFEQFRRTLTCEYFPLAGSQFIIDQLLIKKRNKFDIYIVFATMFMIISRDLENSKTLKLNLTDIVTPEKTKQVIKCEDIVDIFKVLYANVPAYHIGEELESKNRLLEVLLNFDEFEEKEKGGGSQDQLAQEQYNQFVVEGNQRILRLGSTNNRK